MGSEPSFPFGDESGTESDVTSKRKVLEVGKESAWPLEEVDEVSLCPHESVFSIRKDEGGQWSMYDQWKRRLHVLTREFVRIQRRNGEEYCHIRVSREGILIVVPFVSGVWIDVSPKHQTDDTVTRGLNNIREMWRVRLGQEKGQMTRFFEERIVRFQTGEYPTLPNSVPLPPDSTYITSIISKWGVVFKDARDNSPGLLVQRMLATEVDAAALFPLLEQASGVGLFFCVTGGVRENFLLAKRRNTENPPFFIFYLEQDSQE